MYLGRFTKRFNAEDDATLVVPRATATVPSREVKAETTSAPEVVFVDRIVEKPVVVERIVEVEKIVEVPVAVKAATPDSNFFPDHLPEEWAKQSAAAADSKESVNS